MVIKSKKDELPDKCSNCGSTKSKAFWDYDDGSVLCDACENKALKKETSLVNPAGFWLRLFAQIIDFISYFFVMVVFFLIASIFTQEGLVSIIIILAVGAVYSGRDYFFKGRGFGKYLLGLRVVKYGNQETGCSFYDSFIRNWILLICINIPIFLLILVLEIIFHKDKRRVGDGITNTMVIVDKKYLVVDMLEYFLNRKKKELGKL